MYTLGVSTRFFATHYLVHPDGQLHNDLHIHHYRLEVQLQSETLGPEGYVTDIDEVKAKLAAFVDRYQGKELNTLEAFQAKNTSLENFCQIAYQELLSGLPTLVSVKMWEDEDCWVSVP